MAHSPLTLAMVGFAGLLAFATLSGGGAAHAGRLADPAAIGNAISAVYQGCTRNGGAQEVCRCVSSGVADSSSEVQTLAVMLTSGDRAYSRTWMDDLSERERLDRLPALMSVVHITQNCGLHG